MKLVRFRVTRFRNVVDSGMIEVDPDATCLVGKNEAGKSGLIEALWLLNPAHGEEFNADEQYPRWLMVQDRKKGGLDEHYPIEAVFALDDLDREAVAAVVGEDVLNVETVSAKRSYGGSLFYTFNRETTRAVANLVGELPDDIATRVAGAGDLDVLYAKVSELVADDEGGPSAADIEAAKSCLAERGITAKSKVGSRIASVLSDRLPEFFRFTNYSTLPGRIDFEDLTGEGSDRPASSGLQTARALLELAGTDLTQLGNDTYELRKGELEAVQIDLTNQVFEYWKQNPHLEVQIDVDRETVSGPSGKNAVSRFLDIRLRDKRTGYSNNFSQRSSGFQWFFSFLAAFSEFEGRDSPVVLLDEPALTLHGRAQADFLRFINDRLAPSSQVLYTTHSPFMVEVDRLARVRVVEDLGPPTGAVASADVMAGDVDSLFPLQAALGYDIAQNLFVGPNNLVVEGTSDFIYFNLMSEACRQAGRDPLDDRWRMLPAGGATNIPTFVALVGPSLDVSVVADSDTRGMQRVENMVEQGLLDRSRLILVSAAAGAKHADTEDLFTVGDYLKLYNGTYNMSVKVNDLPPGDRVTKRLEALNGSFVHGEVAEYFLRHHADVSFTDTTLNNFESLFKLVNTTIES